MTLTEAKPSGAKAKRNRAIAQIERLDALVGAHPQALKDIYAGGKPADPSVMPRQLDGRILAFEHLAGAHMISRPLMQAAAYLMPWRGKRFETGGTAGINRLVSGQAFRFRCEGAASKVDDQPTLRIAYDGLDNPKLVESVVDELRTVGPGVSIGPMFIETASGPQLILWWGLQNRS